MVDNNSKNKTGFVAFLVASLGVVGTIASITGYNLKNIAEERKNANSQKLEALIRGDNDKTEEKVITENVSNSNQSSAINKDVETKGKTVEIAPETIEIISELPSYPDLRKAIDAFDNRFYKEAVNFYKEAANSSPVHSVSILQEASKKFLKKAESFIKNNNGEIDTLSKILLECAQELNPSSREIQVLLNKSQLKNEINQ